MESAREDAENGGESRIYINADDYSGQYKEKNIVTYIPKTKFPELDKEFSHGGSDFYSMYNFAEKILGNEEADIIDVYEAMDMFLPGMFAYRSVLNGGKRMEIPNLRIKEERDKYRDDTMCTSSEVAGDMLLPVFSQGNPEISDEVYENVRKEYLERMRKKKENKK